MGAPLLLGTRPSRLALVQALAVRRLLVEADPRSSVLLVAGPSAGDRDTTTPLATGGGDGLFTSELEAALVAGTIDAAVHSAKDLPSSLRAGLVVAAYPERADVRDVLVLRRRTEVPGEILTGSPRRRAQLKELFPSAVFAEIRGNVETRLRRIAEGRGDATVLAKAGLDRLGIVGWPGLEFRVLPLSEMIPAPGQGAIAVETSTRGAARLAGVDRPEVRAMVELEKFFLQRMGGGCHSADAALATTGGFLAFTEGRGRREVAWPSGAVDSATRRAFLLETFGDWFRE